MTDRDVTALLERAVADVVPRERRPTDAVLARAAARPGARVRKALAGLVGVALVGGGAVVVATGGEDDGRTVDAPKPLRLTVDPPAGWAVVDRPTAVDCTAELAPRTIYRDATIGDLSSCGASGPTVTGPVLAMGRLEQPAAETVRALGTATAAGGIPGFATGFDSAVATITWVAAGGSGDLGYVALAPRAGDEVDAFPDPYGFAFASMSPEALDAADRVTARGYLPRVPVLPEQVSAVDLRAELVNVDPAPGGRVLGPPAVADVLAELTPAPDAAECGPVQAYRTFHLQDARTGRWSRLDVTDDGAGCRTAVSELGGSARITGDPVSVAAANFAAPRAEIAAGAETVRAHGLAVSVPDGWDVVRGATLDPCTLRRPSVVVSGEFRPGCALDARPSHPYVWVTDRALEQDRFTGDYGFESRPRKIDDVVGTTVTWTGEELDLAGHLVEGLLGTPAEGAGRVLVVGLDREQSRGIRESAGRG
jgi:hypothetical protein